MSNQTVADQLRALADRLDEEGEQAIDFSDDMVRVTIQDEVARVLVDQPNSMPAGYWSDEELGAWYVERAKPIAAAICVLLKDISDGKKGTP